MKTKSRLEDHCGKVRPLLEGRNVKDKKREASEVFHAEEKHIYLLTRGRSW